MNTNPVFSLYIPTRIVFGCGEIKRLATEKLPGKKALIVISSRQNRDPTTYQSDMSLNSVRF